MEEEARPQSIETGTPAAPSIESEAPAPRPLAPVAVGERVALMDVLRGVAILGILLVNMQLFFSPIYLQGSTELWWPAPIDRFVEKLIIFLAQAKFYTMFSMLLGMGMAIQMQRAEARGRRFGPMWARRMMWLVLIGACHAVGLWFGDILLTYALVAFALLLFPRRKNTTLLVWTIIFMLLPFLFFGMITVLVEVVPMLSPEAAEQIQQQMADQAGTFAQARDEALVAYSSGSYGEIIRTRLGQLGFMYSFMPIFAWNLLALFLIGFNLGRRRFLQNLPQNLPTVRRWIWWLFGFGVAGSLTMALMIDHVEPGVPSVAGLLQQLGMIVGGPAQSLFYASAIILLWQKESWRRRLTPLAAVGRMALTNYLMHSVVFTTLANSYGFGLYGRIRPSVGILMTLATFALQIPLSNWWLSRFRFGPVEWLWRSLTYWRLQPMRIAPSEAASG
jgi:uncharacterized protein